MVDESSDQSTIPLLYAKPAELFHLDRTCAAMSVLLWSTTRDFRLLDADKVRRQVRLLNIGQRRKELLTQMRVVVQLKP